MIEVNRLLSDRNFEQKLISIDKMTRLRLIDTFLLCAKYKRFKCKNVKGILKKTAVLKCSNYWSLHLVVAASSFSMQVIHFYLIFFTIKLNTCFFLHLSDLLVATFTRRNNGKRELEKTCVKSNISVELLCLLSDLWSFCFCVRVCAMYLHLTVQKIKNKSE